MFVRLTRHRGNNMPLLKRNTSAFLLVVTGILLLSLLPSHKLAAKEREVYVEGGLRYGILYPSGDIRIEYSGNEENIDLSEMGIDDPNGSLSLSIGLQIDRSHFFFNYAGIYYGGSNTVEETKIYNGHLIPAGTVINSEIDIKLYTLIYTYDLLNSKHDLGIGLGLALMDYYSHYFEGGGDSEVTHHQLYPMPLLTVSGILDLNRFELQALIGGAAVKINDNKVAYLTTDLAIRYKFLRRERIHGMISLGFMWVLMYIEFSQDPNIYYQNTDFYGPYLGVRIKYQANKKNSVEG